MRPPGIVLLALSLHILITEGEDDMNTCYRARRIEQMKKGPLGPYIDGYVEHLHAKGYARKSAFRMLLIVVGFSRWLERKHVALGQVGHQPTQHRHGLAGMRCGSFRHRAMAGP